jgi:hypothetical protein
VSTGQADADDGRVTGVFVILAHVRRYNLNCRFLLAMDVITLVYSIAQLVWVIYGLVSGNYDQFRGTGSLAAYITFVFDQVSSSVPWIIYEISHVCLQMLTDVGEPALPGYYGKNLKIHLNYFWIFTNIFPCLD